MATSGLVLRPANIDFSNVLSSGLEATVLSGDAIQIYLTTLGSNNSILPLKVLSSDTIASVKMRIQAYKGFYIKQQRLVYGGRELTRDDSLVKEYGLTDGKVLHLVLRLSDLQNVTIKTVSGKEYVFKLGRSRSIKDLKHKISKKEGGLALEEQQLVLKGERLEDETLIEDLSLGEDSVVHLFVRTTAKVRTKQVGKDAELSVSVIDSVTGNAALSASTGHIKEVLYLPSTRPPTKIDQDNGGAKTLQSNASAIKRGTVDSISQHSGYKIPAILLELVHQVKAGLQRGHPPSLSSEGSGGAYFMHDENGTDIVGVFKPMDEEPMAINNPRGLPLSPNGEGLKRGTRVGEGAYREVAAYILDHPIRGVSKFDGGGECGFAAVPPTLMVQCSHEAFYYSNWFEGRGIKEKIGSLQLFIHAISNCEDMGPANFPVQEVHKICILDIRLANTDRNGGNILVGKQNESADLKLVPIDHGYCLPDKFEDCTFEWLYWPQSRMPFHPDTLQYIETLDAESDIALLRDHGWELPSNCARVFRIATMLLKKGASAGLTPYQIGSLMSRESLNMKSVIERLVDEAESSILPASCEKVFMETLSEILEQYIKKVKV